MTSYYPPHQKFQKSYSHRGGSKASFTVYQFKRILYPLFKIDKYSKKDIGIQIYLSVILEEEFNSFYDYLN